MDFIKFLKNEFSFGKSTGALNPLNPKKNFEDGIAVKEKSKVNTASKKDFKKISFLLKDVVKALPDKNPQNLAGDHDDIASQKWAQLHKDAKASIAKYLSTQKNNFKNSSPKKRLIKNEKFLSDSWRFGLGGAFATCLFLTYVLVSYAPRETARQIAFIDEVFFGFTDKNISQQNFAEKKSEDRAVKADEKLLASAKTLYVMKNAEGLKDGDLVSVSEEELFGRVAGESEINPELFGKAPLPPLPPALPPSPVNSDSAFSKKYREIIDSIKERQELISRKMQEYLDGLVK